MLFSKQNIVKARVKLQSGPKFHTKAQYSTNRGGGGGGDDDCDDDWIEKISYIGCMQNHNIISFADHIIKIYKSRYGEVRRRWTETD